MSDAKFLCSFCAGSQYMERFDEHERVTSEICSVCEGKMYQYPKHLYKQKSRKSAINTLEVSMKAITNFMKRNLYDR